MLQESDLKIGMSITFKMHEGVIVDIIKSKYEKPFYSIVWLLTKNNEIYSFENQYKFQEIYQAEYTLQPHFFYICNLYEILTKYNNNNNEKLYYLGFSRLRDVKRYKAVTDFLYFKTYKDIYLEIIICYRMENKEPVIWINEFNEINNFLFNSDIPIYEQVIKPIKLKDIHSYNKNCVGVDFTYDDDLISICTSVDIFNKQKYINGLRLAECRYKTINKETFIIINS